jgi:DinB superfamily
MKNEIKKQWHRLEHKRILLMQDLSKLNNETLNNKPEPQKWSTLQVIIHLMRAESISLDYMKKKLSFGTNIPRAGFKSKMRLWLLKMFFYMPFKYKAPVMLEDQMPEVSDFNELKNNWASQRLDLKNFLDSLPDNVLESAIWKHQIVGKMNITQMIDFHEIHFDRHQKQIEKTLKAVKS